LNLLEQRVAIAPGGDDGFGDAIWVFLRMQCCQQVDQDIEVKRERALELVDAILEGLLEVTAATGQVFLFVPDKSSCSSR